MWKFCLISLLSCLITIDATITINYPDNVFTNPDLMNKKASFNRGLAKSDDYVKFSHAQDREDLWIYENWFFGMENGIILESGALDGLKYSTSYLFEKFASWTSLHVEAEPKGYANLTRNRPNAVNVHAALCDKPQVLHYTNTDRLAINGFVEYMTVEFMQQWHPQLIANPNLIKSLPTVLCIPLANILRQLGVRHIDVWILDVEGAEYLALLGTNFEEVTISTIVMESNFLNQTLEVLKVDLLKSKGYKCDMVERNTICWHQSFTPSHILPRRAKWTEIRNKEKADLEKRTKSQQKNGKSKMLR